jgi:hypothetical protein
MSSFIALKLDKLYLKPAAASLFDRHDGCRWIDLTGTTPRDELNRVHAAVADFGFVEDDACGFVPPQSTLRQSVAL